MNERPPNDRYGAASFFLARAQEAMEAADHAGSESTAQVLYKEAETWLYMASRCVNPDGDQKRPRPLSAPRQAPRERRSFIRDD